MKAELVLTSEIQNNIFYVVFDDMLITDIWIPCSILNNVTDILSRISLILSAGREESLTECFLLWNLKKCIYVRFYTFVKGSAWKKSTLPLAEWDC